MSDEQGCTWPEQDAVRKWADEWSKRTGVTFTNKELVDLAYRASAYRLEIQAAKEKAEAERDACVKERINDIADDERLVKELNKLRAELADKEKAEADRDEAVRVSYDQGEEIVKLQEQVISERKNYEERHILLKADRDRLQQWVHDLQAGMYINCVYCGHRYGPDDEVPATMADALKEHIEQCPKHPMSRLREALEWYADEDTYRDYYPLTAVPYRRAHILDDAGKRARNALAGQAD